MLSGVNKKRSVLLVLVLSLLMMNTVQFFAVAQTEDAVVMESATAVRIDSEATVHEKTVLDASNSVFSSDDAIIGSTAEIGYTDNTSIELIAFADKTLVSIGENDFINKYSVGQKLRLDFRCYLAASGSAKYSWLTFTVGGLLADEVFTYKEWTRVNFEVPVLVRNNKKYVEFCIENYQAETLYMDDITISDDVLDDTLLGGVELYMLPSQSTKLFKEQQQSFVAISPEGHVVVIDGGVRDDAEYLVTFLKQYTNKVDGWFITHYHSDHMGALSVIMKNDMIEIDTIYHDFPSAAEIIAHAQEGDSLTVAMQDFLANIDRYNGKTIGKGDVYEFGSITIEALNDLQRDIYQNYGNETTIAYIMHTPKEKVLFLGDAGIELGNRLMKDAQDQVKLKACKIVQIAHHGQAGVSEDFYKCVPPEVALTCAPDWLWYSRDTGALGSREDFKTFEVKGWLRELGVRKNIVAMRGLALIE